MRNDFRTFYATLCKRKEPNHTVNPKESKAFAFKSNHKMHMATLNVRGLNKLTKREVIDDIMKHQLFDILLLTETNVNSNCVEYWDSCTAFFSTSIDPKVKEREEKKREENYHPHGLGNEQRITNYRLAADFENAGVGIIVKNSCLNALQEVQHINGRVMTATFTAHGGDVRFVCAYAPHSAYPTEDKEEFYDKLAEHVQQFKGKQFIGGDFNARIHHVRECETDVCGPFILGRGLEYLNNMNERTKESRALFLGFCQMQSLRILNSQFSKPPNKLITYIEKSAGVEFGPPYDAVRFAQIDYWLVADTYKHACTDVQSRQDIVFESDHLVLECRAEISTQANTKKKNRAPKFHKPNRHQWEKYNQSVADLIGQNLCSLKSFQQAVLDSAKRYLDKTPNEKRKPYISRSTWDKIEKRNRIRNTGATSTDIKKLNKEINKMAKKDKQNHLIEQFNENPRDTNKKNLWKAVKGLRTKYTPQYVQMKNERGIHVPLNQRAETIAQYLENKHWKNDQNMGAPSDNYIVRQNGADESLFRLEELNWALKVSKNNKQPGPDNIQMELLKWLDEENRRKLLRLINSWWAETTADVELFQARVVPIFKKGETDNAANYRPISLLSSIYKVYMIMIRQRMQEAVEDKLSATQYGFRPHKSTSHAIYIIRRLQDYAEVKGTQLSLALLDWEKAFDKIQHDKLYQALKRMGFSEHYRKVIEDCYRNPSFFVEDNFGSSTIKKQRSGIRQGCPLSPYLFVIVMSCIDFDIQSTISRRVLNNRVPGLNYDMVFYADDTILFSTDNRALNELLRLTENLSGQYGLKLNRHKCVTIPMNNDGKIHFEDDTPLPKNYEATYLGNELNQEVNVKHEILNKLQTVRITWTKLLPYWKASNANTKWKLRIFDAVIRAKLLYGLETVHLTQAMLKKIDAFQIRGLRKILNLPSTFIDRRFTNRHVLQRASNLMSPHGNNILFSHCYNERRARLLGHIARASQEDPLRQISFQHDSVNRIPYGKKRSGRPRQNWLHYTKKYIYEEKLQRYNYEETILDDGHIYNAANARIF